MPGGQRINKDAAEKGKLASALQLRFSAEIVQNAAL